MEAIVQYLTYKQVADLAGVHIQTIYRWRKSDGFPDPVKLGPATTRFKTEEVQAWLDSRARA
jgi:prophage regulatory protein